jgi:tetratricopeptide (TPR) repeat protein
LGGLYISTKRVKQGLPFVEEALKFFQEGNYPKNVSYCLTQIVRGSRRLGDYSGALRALDQKLQIAQSGGSEPAIADAYAERGAVLIEQENFPKALEQYNQAIQIYERVGNQIKKAYGLANKASILWRFGEYDEAQSAITEATAIASNKGDSLKPLLPFLKLIDAEIWMSKRNFSEARTKLDETIRMAGTEFPDTTAEATFNLGLLTGFTGKWKDAQKLCSESVKIATNTGDAGLTLKAMLAQAEASLEAGDIDSAQRLASELQKRFSDSQQLESEWRTWLIASNASKRAGQSDQAADQLAKAKNTFQRLQESWGNEFFAKYQTRPDIQIHYKELN